MRITNSMMRTNSLWSINKNEELMMKYETQLSTGKKIQKPSDDPVVAVRALKFRTNLKEVKQYKTNAEDATSWLQVSEQSMSNTINILKRSRDLCVQGASDIYKSGDRNSIIAELEQLKVQMINEGNVNYAGRHVFTGYRTDLPLSYTKDTTANYNIQEHLNKASIETISKVVDTANAIPPDVPEYEIRDAHRMRLAYDKLNATPLPISNAAGDPFEGYTINAMDSTDTDAYEPGVNTVNFLKDTGELVFNAINYNSTTATSPYAIPTNIEVRYNKTSFIKGDMIPENYFDCEYIHPALPVTPNTVYTRPNDPDPNKLQSMKYQISYNQDLSINTLGNEAFTSDMLRDFDEIIKAVRNVPSEVKVVDPENPTPKELAQIKQKTLVEDILGNFFEGMLTKLDKHINTFVREQAVVGGKINRLELTINRLDDDKVNFTELLSKNEDADMTEAVLNLKAQEIVYNASLASSSALMQKSLIDFIR